MYEGEDRVDCESYLKKSTFPSFVRSFVHYFCYIFCLLSAFKPLPHFIVILELQAASYLRPQAPFLQWRTPAIPVPVRLRYLGCSFLFFLPTSA